jgi:ATP-binding cassette subfamily C protein CydD
VQLTETDNQAYFDKNKAREKVCAGWLTEQSKAVQTGFIGGCYRYC